MTDILIVDDDLETTRIFEVALKKIGYTPHIVGTVPAARAFLEQVIPPIILLDMMLPGINGLDLLREIRATPTHKDIFIVIISAHVIEESLLQPHERPNVVMRKPIRIPELRTVLEQAFA